ncbi:MAG: tRNA (adenosine(37)-N6)-threonylcarbamoyltransferase complex ATPase subunit type 1 TsaE [Methyloglobulus sp.]|nr:tRNA (adenosine(37)-N6)-threonylcarbamoyltransferase complex ATPase subunit type 1 TsaE [Methyloglobulus sp.]
MHKYLGSSEETEQFGAELYHLLAVKSVVFLHGDLGAGKTTLVRGYLRAAGYAGTVKSPTYNIVEEYLINDKKIYHFDLYRMNSPEELEWIGINDYFKQESICFIEWPNQGEGYLPQADTVISLRVEGSGRVVELSHRLSE